MHPVSTTSIPPATLDRLREIADSLAQAVDAAHVIVALVHNNEWSATVATHPDADTLDEVDRRAGGPALDALWAGQVIRIASTGRDTDWPEYSAACRRLGIESVAAFPIADRGRRIGVMTVASHVPCAFDAEATRIGTEAALAASLILRGERPLRLVGPSHRG
jgi:GAF domain-containing protein